MGAPIRARRNDRKAERAGADWLSARAGGELLCAAAHFTLAHDCGRSPIEHARLAPSPLLRELARACSGAEPAGPVAGSLVCLWRAEPNRYRHGRSLEFGSRDRSELFALGRCAPLRANRAWACASHHGRWGRRVSASSTHAPRTTPESRGRVAHRGAMPAPIAAGAVEGDAR